MSIEYLLSIGALLILVSITFTKLSDNLGVPVLVLFLGVGMFAGSEGPGGIFFDNAEIAQNIGIVALIFILFAGGLDTEWTAVRPVLKKGLSLATAGVLITAVACGAFAIVFLDFTPLNGFLLGAIISSTDAAAVFSVLRSKNVSLRGNLKPLLELESGSNDPMAVFLTIGMIQLIMSPVSSLTDVIILFIIQMAIGSLFGIGLGRLMVYILNHLKLGYEGLYPVFSLAFAALVYGVTAGAGGSGFLAVYICGLVASCDCLVHKKTLLRFFDGLAWLSQITMFLTLRLLVFPSRLLPVIDQGILLAAFLMFIARPLSVYISLLWSDYNWREKLFISWVGLRGAVPIVLSTFPLLAGVPDAGPIFSLVFFIVLMSALIQGWSIPTVARFVGVAAPMELLRRYPIEFAPISGVDAQLVDLMIPYNSAVVGKSLVELRLPQDSLIVLISRGGDFIVPSGGTVLQESDTILTLVNEKNLPLIRSKLSELKQNESP